MKRTKFTEKDRGWNAVKRFFKDAHSMKVDVGIFGDARDFATPSAAALGSIHEYGSQDGTIPSRSFMRSTFDENRKKYKTQLTEMIKKALASRGRIRVAAAYETIGEVMVSDVKKRIINREIKQDLKHRDGTALYDTGNLVRSIEKRVTRK